MANELDRQVQVLVAKGYPALAGLSVAAFDALFDPLRAADRRPAPPASAGDRTPMVLVVKRELVTPEQAMPLTALKNQCFSRVGSRSGDRRVPALWISQGRPKLGWCWAGNPHTWLGSASCGARSQ